MIPFRVVAIAFAAAVAVICVLALVLHRDSEPNGASVRVAHPDAAPPGIEVGPPGGAVR